MKKLKKENWVLLWVIGMAGQICWNLENQWFNTFVYNEIAPDHTIVSWMVAISAVFTTFSTFFFGTLSDRIGKRKPFIAIGYILWGIFTILFGSTMFLTSALSGKLAVIATFVVLADALMSFFGSMGNDSGFNAWIGDILNDENRGGIGAALAAQPVLGTIIGTLLGGFIIVAFGYFAFFTIMGVIVILIGIFALLKMKDSKNLKPVKNGSFWHQFASAFNFKRFFRQKELVVVNVMIAIFFISFNVYFVHIGNLFIYNYQFDESEAGIIQGVGLLVAVLFTIPASKLINKDKSPFVILLTLIVNFVGLMVLFLFSAKSEPSALFSLTNVPLFLGIILCGIGYVLFMQTTMVWVKKLYPIEERGQYEGIRIIFFVLIPMILGPMIANPVIEGANKKTYIKYDEIYLKGFVPTEKLFIVAAIISLLTFIPLFFANKHHKERIKEKCKKD